MSRLHFNPVPPGPTPLFIAEPDDASDRGALFGSLRCDHWTKAVYFVPADPYRPHYRPDLATSQRYSVFEIDAMMPRRQLVGLYGEVRPLLERLDEGLTLRTVAGAWIRSLTPEAEVAYECLDAALDVEAEAPELVFMPSAPTLQARPLEMAGPANKLLAAMGYGGKSRNLSTLGSDPAKRIREGLRQVEELAGSSNEFLAIAAQARDDARAILESMHATEPVRLRTPAPPKGPLPPPSSLAPPFPSSRFNKFWV